MQQLDAQRNPPAKYDPDRCARIGLSAPRVAGCLTPGKPGGSLDRRPGLSTAFPNCLRCRKRRDTACSLWRWRWIERRNPMPPPC